MMVRAAVTLLYAIAVSALIAALAPVALQWHSAQAVERVEYEPALGSVVKQCAPPVAAFKPTPQPTPTLDMRFSDLDRWIDKYGDTPASELSADAKRHLFNIAPSPERSKVMREIAREILQDDGGVTAAR